MTGWKYWRWKTCKSWGKVEVWKRTLKLCGVNGIWFTLASTQCVYVDVNVHVCVSVFPFFPFCFPLRLLTPSCRVRVQVCSHYNKGSGQFGACTFKENCTKVHMCLHFVQDNCIFGTKCNRLHRIDEYSYRMLEERGLGTELIQDLPFLYQNVYRLSSSAADAGECGDLKRRICGFGAQVGKLYGLIVPIKTWVCVK